MGLPCDHDNAMTTRGVSSLYSRRKNGEAKLGHECLLTLKPKPREAVETRWLSAQNLNRSTQASPEDNREEHVRLSVCDVRDRAVRREGCNTVSGRR